MATTNDDAPSVGTVIDPGPGKWYGLEWQPCDSEQAPRQIPYGEMETIAARLHTTAVGDHCYNPTVIFAWCAERNVALPSEVLDTLMDAWLRYYYDYDFDCLPENAGSFSYKFNVDGV